LASLEIFCNATLFCFHLVRFVFSLEDRVCFASECIVSPLSAQISPQYLDHSCFFAVLGSDLVRIDRRYIWDASQFFFFLSPVGGLGCMFARL